jgi:hypothetical protein
MRGYTITSKPRFIAFITISIILFTLIFNFMFEINTAQSETVQKYVHVGVFNGDTLWYIAEEYMPDMDTREAVYMLQQLNDLESSNLIPGMIIDVPVE